MVAKATLQWQKRSFRVSLTISSCSQTKSFRLLLLRRDLEGSQVSPTAMESDGQNSTTHFPVWIGGLGGVQVG